MRGGTSKGIFFNLFDLPEPAQVPGKVRDRLLLRVIGSPDPYSKHTDGMGGATSSTSKSVIISVSEKPGHDVDYLFGQVSVDRPFVDWSGNCGNLSSAVGAFAIRHGLIEANRIPDNGTCEVRIWQANIGKTIINRVPVCNGEVQETGGFRLDGVTFPAAEVPVEFISPINVGEAVFSTGNVTDDLHVPGVGRFRVTMINAGIPTVFLNAADIGYIGTELQEAINADEDSLQRLETIRAHAAVCMGLVQDISQATSLQHTPKIAFCAEPRDYDASGGRKVSACEIDLNVRALSMGKLHHAMMGTVAVAIASAAAIPGSLVNLVAGGGSCDAVTFGHPSGTLKVGAAVSERDGEWRIDKVSMSRSARVLMEGWVHVPSDVLYVHDE